MHVFVRPHAFVRVSVCTCVLMCMCACTVCACVCMCACVNMHVCTYVCVRACMHVCAWVCMHVCAHACVRECVHACTYVPVYIHVCVRVCVHVCVWWWNEKEKHGKLKEEGRETKQYVYMKQKRSVCWDEEAQQRARETGNVSREGHKLEQSINGDATVKTVTLYANVKQINFRKYLKTNKKNLPSSAAVTTPASEWKREGSRHALWVHLGHGCQSRTQPEVTGHAL